MPIATVRTPYGVVDVPFEEGTSEIEIRSMALEKARLQSLNKEISKPVESQDVSLQEEISSAMPEKEIEPSYREDLVNNIGRYGAGVSSFLQDIVNGSASLVGADADIIDDDFVKSTNASFVNAFGSLMGVEPKDVMTEEGEFKEMTTTAGEIGQVVPYLGVGAGSMKALAVAAPKIPQFVNALISGAFTDNLLYLEQDGNISKAIKDAELPVEDVPLVGGILKDFVEYVATDEDDPALTQRVNVALEGLAFMGTLEGVVRSLKIAKNVAFPSAGTVEEQVDAASQMLKDARDAVDAQNTSVTHRLDVSETPEGIAQIEMQASSALQRFKNKFFKSNGYWTPTAYNFFRGKVYAERQVVAEASNIANRLTKALNKLDYEIPEETLTGFLTESLNASSDFYKGLITKGEYEESALRIAQKMGIPDDAAIELINARNLIDSLSSKLVNSTIPNDQLRQTILENSGEYIRRSYRLFEDSGYKPDENLKHIVVESLYADNLAKGIEPELAYKQALGKIDALLNKANDFAAFDHFEKSVRVNKEILTGKKEIDENIRKLMGEITNPAENIILSVSKVARLVESNKFADNLLSIAQDRYIFNSETTDPRTGIKYIKKISGTNSSLDGMYTTEEMAQAIMGRQDLNEYFTGKIWDQIGQLKGRSQAMKTVASHQTQLRNIVGGAQFGLANGLNPFKNTLETFKTLKNAAKNQGDKFYDELYEKYLGLGVINTNVRVNEFRRLIEETAEGNARTLSDIFDKKIPGAETIGKAYAGAEKTYVAVDDFFKINAFEQELATLKKAFPNEPLEVLEKQASKIIQDTFPNYDKVFPGVKSLRNLPVGSFVSFPAEIMRTSVSIIRQASDEISSGNPVLAKRGRERLAGFTASMGIWSGIATGSAMLAGLTTEEVEAIQKLSETDYSKGTRIPYRGEDGQIYTLDTQFIDSYSVLKEPLLVAYDRINSGRLKGEALGSYLAASVGNGIQTLLKPYIEQSMVTEAVTDVIAAMANKGVAPGGKRIFAENMPLEEKIGNGFAHIANSFLPGSASSFYKLFVEAGTTGIAEDFFGMLPEVSPITGETKYDPSLELAANMSGIRFQKFDPVDSIVYAAQSYKRRASAWESSKPKYDKTPEELEEIAMRNIEANYEAQQDLYMKAQQAVNLLGKEAVFDLLVDEAKIGKKTAFGIINNFYTDEDWNKSRLSDFYKLRGTDEQIDIMVGRVLDYQNKFRQTSLVKLDDVDEEQMINNSRRQFARGGEVYDVPNAPSEPDERIDKMTGRPYNEQAGPAFMDEEDPMRRLSFAEGSIVARALGISDEDIAWAKGIGKKYGEAEELDGKGDAARHLALGWLAKQSKYPSAAKFAANAREIVELDFKGRKMDWANNEKGFNLEAKNKQEAEKAISKMIEAGEAVFMTPSESRKMRGYARGGKVNKKEMACNSPQRTPQHPKKSHVVKACENGKEKIIRFGEQGAETAGKPKAGESERMKKKRKSFKARHAKNIKKGKMSAAYWADKEKW